MKFSVLPKATVEPLWYSDTFITLFTVSGFILAVLALGILLKSRYPGTVPGDSSASGQVVERVILLVALNAYDLICTLFANAIGGLWELNPFVRSILNDRLFISHSAGDGPYG